MAAFIGFAFLKATRAAFKRVSDGSARGAAGVAACALLAAACSGGGGSSAPSVTPPPPAPAPAPAPPPPAPAPPSIPANGAEFQLNAQAFGQINALPAYEAGVFGAGALVSIIDTGYDTSSNEFNNRINPNSVDLVPPSERTGPSTLDDQDGHGGAIAAIIGAARDETGMHGVAPEAELLIFRGDDDGPEDLVILGEAIREGIIRSGNLGADVLNLSLGSNEPAARSTFRSFFSRSSTSDIVTVIAAGNEGVDDPEASALAAIDPQANGTVIIAGSVDDNNEISSFSNRAGDGRNFFITAPGELFVVPQQDAPPNSIDFFSGTSASTPIIAGAAALVRSVWPALSAQDVVQILLTTATDLGAPGVDVIYGHGLLNIEAALAPSGALGTSTASGLAVSLSAAPALSSPAFGASLAPAGEYVFLDSFGRDFAAPLSTALTLNADGAARLQGFMPADMTTRAGHAQIGGASVRVRLDDLNLAIGDAAASLRAPSVADSDPVSGEAAQLRDPALRFAATHRLFDRAEFTMAQGFTPRELDGFGGLRPFNGEIGRLSLTADGFDDPYLAFASADIASAFSFQVGEAHINAFAATSSPDDSDYDPFRFDAVGAPRRVSNMRVGASFASGSDQFSLDVGVRAEEGAIFGAAFGGALGGVAESLTTYQSARADVGLAGGWRAYLNASVGVSDVAAAGDGFAGAFDRLISTQFAASLYRRGAFREGDALALSILQPLRVEGGGVNLSAPVAYDPFTERFDFADQRFAFGAAPRRLDFEGAYRLFGFGGASFEAGLLYQLNARPGPAQGTAENAAAALLRASGRF